MIPFNQAPVVGTEIEFINQAIAGGKLSGDGAFTEKAQQQLSQLTGCESVLLTPSCTAALEMAAILLDLKAGDEVIMPSFTFVSTANAFALRGATIVFTDVDPSTMNICPLAIEKAITSRTKAIVPVHYAGVACDMKAIMSLANQHELFVVEDAAQAIGSYYKGKALGTIGHFGTFSFHDTKNITSGGEGGALLINDETLVERAEIIREKGTNRHQFFRGQVDKYSWVDIGSSYLPSEIQAAYLCKQLENLSYINKTRLAIWQRYFEGLRPLVDKGELELPTIPEYSTNNAHMFYIKVTNLDVRTALIAHLKEHAISASFHYIPLHSSKAGKKYGRFHGQDQFTSSNSERLLRLPLFFNLSTDSVDYIIGKIFEFYR